MMVGMAVEASLQGILIQAPYPQMDEYSQPDVDYDAGDLERTGRSKSRRGTKGNRTAQWRRWRARNRARRNDYNKRWMAASRQAYSGF